MSDHQQTYFEYDNSKQQKYGNGKINTQDIALPATPALKLKSNENNIENDIYYVNNIKRKPIEIDDDDDDDKTVVSFWTRDPNVLLNQKYVFEFYPSENMVYEQKLNAISRLVILITIIVYCMGYNIRFLFIGAITLFFIAMLYQYKNNEKDTKKTKRIITENFDNPQGIESLKNLMHNNVTFHNPTPENPMGNVLNTDIAFHPNRKPAPPAFNEITNNDILSQAKQFVRDANPDQPDITEKLFKDLGDQFTFEQSMRQFISNPSTTIPNDQGAFSDFCYGSMISCKEENDDACLRNQVRYTNY